MPVNISKDRVASSATRDEKRRFNSFVKKTDSCWFFQGGYSQAYGNFRMRGRNFLAHRMAKLWQTKIGSTPLFALHRCNEKRCVRPAHIYFGTNKENAADAMRAGTFPSAKGEMSTSSKVKEETVRKIWALYHSTDLSASKVAKKFSVPLPLVHGIILGDNWKHLKHDVERQPVEAMWEKRAHGEGSPWAKITARDLVWICSDLNEGKTILSIAQRAGVSTTSINRIAEGKGWIKAIRDMGIYLKIRKPKRLMQISDYSEHIRKKAEKLMNQGESYYEIARQLKITPRVANALANGLTKCAW